MKALLERGLECACNSIEMCLDSQGEACLSMAAGDEETALAPLARD